MVCSKKLRSSLAFRSGAPSLKLRACFYFPQQACALQLVQLILLVWKLVRHTKIVSKGGGISIQGGVKKHQNNVFFLNHGGDRCHETPNLLLITTRTSNLTFNLIKNISLINLNTLRSLISLSSTENKWKTSPKIPKFCIFTKMVSKLGIFP